ncbi:MAG: DUF3035 domain-containing protein, partial [Alphaproteobacteria bacterium]
ALLLAGCGESGRIFGFERGGPDEFTVVRNPPLSVPPQATLRPPLHGESQSSRDLSTNQARASLLASGGDTAGTAGTLVTDQGTEPYNGEPLPRPQQDGTSSWYETLQPPTQTTVADPSAPAAPGSEQNTAVAGTYPQTAVPATPPNGAPGIPIQYEAQSRPSTGEVALAQRATAYYGVEPNVRRKVNAESAQLALEQDKFLYLVLFWLDPEPPGAAHRVDCKARPAGRCLRIGQGTQRRCRPVDANENSNIFRARL